ncbi:P-type DNA transfer protein VirB5 [Microvirgula aerodenitrificans]|uniref:P-type DNA transfer protein VirB5 n=1 Tax=Microvirgula aerodenitrificans TaxID=57480 RepID=UPI00248EBFDD|nr:P-type DNA transfer protein VirB5 [Microvirgula aerodenitrificans]
MKKQIIAMAVSTLLFSQGTFAQIPTTDTASIAQQAMQQMETIAQWKRQYDQMMSQIEQAKKQYESLTGSRGMGNIMNNPALRDYLPADWQGVYDSVRNGGYAGLSGRGASVYAANKVFDSCQSVKAGDQRTACEARAVKASQDKGFALEAYDAAKSRINQIDQLMGKINQTQDPKAIAELQGRIAAEQANIQNEQTKLQLYAMVSAAEEKVQQQRQREIQARTWNAKKGIAAQPLTFGH